MLFKILKQIKAFDILAIQKGVNVATFTDLRILMRNFSTFSIACLFYFILLSVRKVSYIGER